MTTLLIPIASFFVGLAVAYIIEKVTEKRRIDEQKAWEQYNYDNGHFDGYSKGYHDGYFKFKKGTTK